MVTATPVKRKSSFLLEGRGILLVLVFVLALIALITCGSRDYHYTHYSTSLSEPLLITAAPGQDIFLTITTTTSLNGLWAAPTGLTLALNEPAGFATQVVEPQQRNWSYIETANTDGETIVIDGSFVVPTPDQAGASVLSGRLVGTLVYPDPAIDGMYHNTTQRVSLPVFIQLLAPSMVFGIEQLPLYLAGSAGILLLLAIPTFFRFYDVRRQRTSLPQK